MPRRVRASSASGFCKLGLDLEVLMGLGEGVAVPDISMVIIAQWLTVRSRFVQIAR